MVEWNVITVLVVVVGLISTVTAPMLKLNSTITKLNTTLDELTRRVDKSEIENNNGHKRLWDHCDAQDLELANHEQRIGILEHDHARMAGRCKPD